MQRRDRTVFACRECGLQSIKWQGRCPECLTWNAFVERPARLNIVETREVVPLRLQEVPTQQDSRLVTRISEFDRVLGGGIVPGSLILLGGDPGIGKSTVVLQVAAALARQGPVLYISGEESAPQLKLRADRLGVTESDLYLCTEANLEAALAVAERLPYKFVVVDSIQTVYVQDAEAPPGGVVQLRECAMRLMHWAKGHQTPVILIGHVTKDGEIAGPRVLEHIVDVVLYLEGERFSQYRLLRGVKNRFGSVSEVGIFEMRDAGMVAVDNPSEVLLAERVEGAVGSVVVPVIEGSRSLLVEVQALASPAVYSIPQRKANGLDLNRLLLVTAVLTRRAGLHLAEQDVLVNVTGGLRVQEPAADLGLALAIASSACDSRIPGDLVAVGEIGLSGEVRSVGQMDRRLAEAERLGFRRCILPQRAVHGLRSSTVMELIPVRTVWEALAWGLPDATWRSRHDGDRSPRRREAGRRRDTTGT